MTLNGVSMYPILEPGEEAIDLSKLWEQGHDPSINMKLDQQLDSCNEHAGRGFDIHYRESEIIDFFNPYNISAPSAFLFPAALIAQNILAFLLVRSASLSSSSSSSSLTANIPTVQCILIV